MVLCENGYKCSGVFGLSMDTEIIENKMTFRFLPKLRVVDGNIAPSKEEEESLSEIEKPRIEYRDEAERPWWKFFDEYEYRLNKFERKRHKWWYWFDEGTSKEEKILICKLDILVAFYVFVMFWLKILDQSNLANAYVSNMKEDLGMKGNDLVNTNTCYNVAAVVFQIPAMYLFPRIPLHFFFPLLDLCWGLFTLFTYKINTVGQLQAMRFFVGVFESSFYPAVHYILGSWYLPQELGRRGMLYYFGSMIGNITSGLLQGSIYRHMNGVNGLAGWRWMFIIDGVITFPLAFVGLLCVPGTPYKCYSIWLSDDEIRLARRRLERANITPPPAKPPNFFNRELWKRILCDWKIYGLTLLSICCWNNSTTSGSGFILWLKALNRYSIEEVNNLSCLAPGVGFGLVILVCGGADFFRSRYGAIVLSSILNIVINIILVIWDVPEPAKWFSFACSFAGWSSVSVFFTWCSDVLRRDPQERAITFIFLFMVGQAFCVWIGRLVWPTVDAPQYLTGYATTLAFAVLTIIMSFLVLYFYKRDDRRFAFDNGIVLYNSKTGDIPEPVISELAPSIEEVNEKFESFEKTTSISSLK